MRQSRELQAKVYDPLDTNLNRRPRPRRRPRHLYAGGCQIPTRSPRRDLKHTFFECSPITRLPDKVAVTDCGRGERAVADAARPLVGRELCTREVVYIGNVGQANRLSVRTL